MYTAVRWEDHKTAERNNKKFDRCSKKFGREKKWECLVKLQNILTSLLKIPEVN
jgi:hypothetical protein